METLQNMLVAAGEKLGVATEYVYDVLLQQAKVELVIDILLLIGVLIAAIAAVSFVKFCHKKAKADKYSEWDVGFTVSAIFTSVFGTIGFFTIVPECIMEIVQIIVNPPVWVLQFLVDLVNTVK